VAPGEFRGGDSAKERQQGVVTAAFPQFANSIQAFRDTVANLQNFKIDPKQITQLALAVFEDLGTGFAGFLDWAETAGQKYYDSFMRDFVNPIREWIGDIQDARRNIIQLANDANGAFKMVRTGIFGEKKINQMSVDETREWSGRTEGAEFLRQARGTEKTDWQSIAPVSIKPLIDNLHAIEPMLAAANAASFCPVCKKRHAGQ